MNNKTSSIPLLQYVLVDTRFTHEEPIGFQEAEWVQTVAIPDRAWGLNVIFRQGGMMYRNLPPHAISFEWRNPDAWTLREAQMWNCYGNQYEHLLCDHLADSRMIAWIHKQAYSGTYLFQTSFIGDSYSMTPEQDKTFFWIKLDNNRLTIQPSNRVRFHDASYNLPTSEIPKLKLQEDIYRCIE